MLLLTWCSELQHVTLPVILSTIYCISICPIINRYFAAKVLLSQYAVRYQFLWTTFTLTPAPAQRLLLVILWRDVQDCAHSELEDILNSDCCDTTNNWLSLILSKATVLLFALVTRQHKPTKVTRQHKQKRFFAVLSDTRFSRNIVKVVRKLLPLFCGVIEHKLHLLLMS